MNGHFEGEFRWEFCEGAFRWEFCEGACFILWRKRSSGFIPRQFHLPNFLDSPQSGISAPSTHEMFPPLFRLYFLSLKGDTPTLQGVILFHVVFICADSHTDSLCIQVVKLQQLQFPRELVLCRCFSRWNPGFPRVPKKPGCQISANKCVSPWKRASSQDPARERGQP